MKKSKILAPALAILCLSTAASVTGTVAWFAANNIVTANGMTIKASAPASIVISKDILPTSTTTEVAVSFEASAVELSPCTHVDASATITDAPFLGTVNAAEGVISKSTGLPSTEAEYDALTYSLATENSHYIHKVIYIATAPYTNPIEDRKITVTLSSLSTLGTSTLLAGSISYFVKYVQNPATDNVVGDYKGTLNLAEKNRASNQALDLDPNTIDLYTASALTPIPSASTGRGVRVDMYAYFDGGLFSAWVEDTYSAWRTYVYTDLVDINDLALDSEFKLATI